MSRVATLREQLGPNATRVAVIASLVLVLLLVVFLLSRLGGGTYEVRGVFDDVRGLIPGGEVRAGSLGVGTVTEVEVTEKDRPVVTMEIDDDFRLHQGATADILLGSNVGAVNRVVELSEGDTSAPELPEGTTLTGEDTEQPVNFDEAVQTLDPSTRANIKRFLGGLDAALEGRGRDFDRTLRHSSAAFNETANLLAQVNRDGRALSTLVGEGERVVSALASSPQDVGEATESTAQLLEITGNRQAELGESIRLLGPALSHGRQALDRLAEATPSVRKLVAGLDPVVDELGPFARLLPDAAEAAGPFLVETRKLVENAPRDLKRLRPIVRAADPVAEQLDPVARFANPFAQELRVYSPEIVGFFQNLGAASGSYDANGHVINILGGVFQTLPASTASNTIGPDESGPGLLEEPFIRFPGTNAGEPWRNFERSCIGPNCPSTGGGG